MSRWVLRFEARLNDLLYCAQLCCLTLQWVSIWVFRCPAWLKYLLHCAQLYCLTPPWVSMCLLRVPAWLKDFSHCAQLFCFTPLWLSMLVLEVWMNNLLHWTEVCSFSPEWGLFLLKDFLHCSQFCCSSLVWVCLLWNLLEQKSSKSSFWHFSTFIFWQTDCYWQANHPTFGSEDMFSSLFPLSLSHIFLTCYPRSHFPYLISFVHISTELDSLSVYNCGKFHSQG